MYPHAPKSWWAIIIPFAIALSILYFDFTQPEVYRTNPVVLFAIPIIFSLIYMRGESFDTIMESFGLNMPTAMDKLINIAGVVVGITVGIVLYYFLTLQAGIIPLYFIPLAQAGIGGIFMLYGVVAVSEEIMTLQYAKIAANKFYGYGLEPFPAVLSAQMVGRAFWTSLHWFAYGGYMGLQALPLFIMAFSLGMIFSILAMGFGSLRKRYFLLSLAIACHFSYDVWVSLHLAMII